MGVAFVAGTTAEVIKLAPVMVALRDAGHRNHLWNTAQHVEGVRAVLDDLGLPPPDEQFIAPSRQRSLVRAGQVPGWAVRVLAHALRHHRRLRRALADDGTRPVVVVHGDTFTTVLGALIGRLLSAEVVHVEAGMRSGRLLHPFPEELNRRLVARLAKVHFAPTEREADNLRREHARGEIVVTGANTAVDALRMMLESASDEVDLELPATFGLVTLHRFELLRNDSLLGDTLRRLQQAGRTTPLVMPAGDTERRRIEGLGLTDLFDQVHFRLVPKRSYPRFVPLLRRASFVVTDSGGLQQECAILGMPCAVHREATESQDGLGRNVVLTGWNLDRLGDFLRDWPRLSEPSRLDEHHPTDVVVRHLERLLSPTPAL